MKTSFLFITAFFVLSCSNNSSETNSVNDMELIAETNDSLAIIDENKVAPFNPNSPEGWVLGEFFASDDNEYIFCQTGELFFDNHVAIKLEGTWELKNDTLYLNYTKQITEIGIGNPLPMSEAVPGNYVDQYESYKTEESKIAQQEYLIWSEIKTYLDQDSTYPYAIKQYNYNCK